MTRHYRQTGKCHVRREVNWADVPSEDLAGPASREGKSPSSQARARECDEALERALAQLPEEYREIIRLRNYERLSFAEAGECMARSAEAARKLWGRAIDHLQRILEPPHEP